MMTVAELKEWVASLPDNAFVGVDYGGLALAVVENNQMTGSYLDIGGIPEEIESP